MPRAKATAALASLIESDSEPDLDFFDAATVQSARAPQVRAPMSTAKKPRGRPTSVNRVVKLTPKTTRRSSGRLAAAAAAATAAVAEDAPREALADRSNQNALRVSRNAGKQAAQATPLTTPAQPTTVASTRTKATRGRPRTVGSAVKERVNSVAPKSIAGSTTKPRGRPPARLAMTLADEIPETQPGGHTMEAIVEEMEVETDQPPVVDILDGFDLSHAAVRRRLGELTRNHESLQMRYKDLQEIGIKEAERNFEQLRKQADERSAAAKKLISELKLELAAQTALVKQGKETQKRLEKSETEVKELKATVEQLKASLAELRTENKTLSTKLAATRSTDLQAPGSAMKSSMLGQHAALAKAKEELYGDLTGLIMRNVRREKLEDVFDCIQTGRNGALHFKLAVETLEVADSYDDVQFTYKPQLDPSRDQELIEMLPDYLVEEITFPRPQASKFYARVIKSLTERMD